MTMQTYLELGIPVDARAPDGSTPLHWSSVQDSREIANLLLKKSADIDVSDLLGQTPLMSCANHENADLAAWFLEHGADVDAKNDVGATALHYAAELGNVHLVQLLLDAGVDRTVESKGYTPRSIAEAKGHGEVVRMLGEE